MNSNFFVRDRGIPVLKPVKMAGNCKKILPSFLFQNCLCMSSTGVVKARSLLPPDIVSYIDRSFTKRGLQEHIVGKKTRNYPKRSIIAKWDPESERVIYPDETDENSMEIEHIGQTGLFKLLRKSIIFIY